MAQINQLPVQSHTTRRGNTFYWGGASAVSNDGTRGAARGFLAFDQGSDGTIDGGLRARGAAGPHGAIGRVAGFGPHHAGAAGIATNGEAVKTWSRFV